MFLDASIQDTQLLIKQMLTNYDTINSMPN